MKNKIQFPFQPIRMRRGDIFRRFEMQRPGAYHHARFMGKSIYLLKIFLLSLVFPLSQQQERKIKKLVGYVIHLYGRYFLSAPLGTAAARHDLAFWYDLIRYEHFEPQLARAVRTSIRRHLWYLTPELVVLCLFDDHLPEEEKQMMAAALRQVNRPARFATGKPGQPNFNPVAAHLGPQRPHLSSFVTERSWLLFALLGVNELDWLDQPPLTWINHPSYQYLHNFCKDLQVVNDPAERAVKDVQDFAQMTRDPADQDNVILVANDHRGRVACFRKGNLNNV